VVVGVSELERRKPAVRERSHPEPLASGLSLKRLLHEEGMKAVPFLGFNGDGEARTTAVMASGQCGKRGKSRASGRARGGSKMQEGVFGVPTPEDNDGRATWGGGDRSRQPQRRERGHRVVIEVMVGMRGTVTGAHGQNAKWATNMWARPRKGFSIN
jgi:hypothetical protein